MAWRVAVLAGLIGLAAGENVAAAERGGAVYNITLRTDSTPDLTDLPSYLTSITSQYKEPQEQAINIWRWSQRLRKQTSNPAENGQDVFDPVQFFNSYGYCNCGVVSGLNNTFWLNMGWQAHYVQLGDHTVCEASWDGGASWHMFDASMSIYCFNDAGRVASVREIEKNPRFYLENFAPECGTNPVKGPDDRNGWRSGSDWPVQYQRTLADGWDSYRPPNSVSDVDLHAQWGQRFVLNLRPDEYYLRSFEKRGDTPSDPRYLRSLTNNGDPETQHGHAGIRGNGVWHYAPDLRADRAAERVYDSAGVAWGGARGFAVRPSDAGRAGSVVFKVSAANVVTSARLALVASRQTAADAVSVEVSTTAGITNAPVWSMSGTGAAVASDIDLSSAVAGTDEYLVRVRMNGAGAGLERVAIETNTQINRASLPRLVRGANRVQLVAGPQVETIQFRPAVTGGNHRATAFEENAVDVEKETGYYKPTLRPARNGEPSSVTWRIQTPTPIVDVSYGATVCVKSLQDRVTMLHSWDGKTFGPDYEKRSDAPPFDLMINRDVADAPPEATSAYLRYEFQTPHNAKSYSGPGIQYATMTVHHQPRIAGAFTPIDITYCWIEHRESGDVERRHTQRVNSPAEEYAINVGGFRDPTMKWVRLNLHESGPAGDAVVYGYSDGQDVGPGATATRARYHWGRNLALGKPYTLRGAQSDKNPDAGGDLTDGIIAPPDTYVSKKYMPTNVIFEKDATSVATIDLGEAQSIAAVRVHAGQEPGFHLAYPARMTVETSLDGQEFRPAGRAEHNQVFDPPADFLPWEHDDSPRFASLPAGGRLAYAYRIIFDRPTSARYVRVTCARRPGWGTLLSEIQAFDHVAVDKDVPPSVVLPKLNTH